METVLKQHFEELEKIRQDHKVGNDAWPYQQEIKCLFNN
jgi:hypothetical protein